MGRGTRGGDFAVVLSYLSSKIQMLKPPHLSHKNNSQLGMKRCPRIGKLHLLIRFGCGLNFCLTVRLRDDKFSAVV